MTIRFSYGERNGRLVHVSDLTSLEHRGLSCGCTCRECGGLLQAHLGSKKAWHFQHHVENANCNPKPMTLLHAFVRDELAAWRLHVIPRIDREQTFEFNGRFITTPVPLRSYRFEVLSAQAEQRGDGVQPDVVCILQDGSTLVLEVRYTHAVDDEKRKRLEASYTIALEFDVSDLPARGVTQDELVGLVQNPNRWTWLAGSQLRYARAQAGARWDWTRTHWQVSTANFTKIPKVRPASEKLKHAARRMGWARAQLQALKERGIKGDVGARWLGQQDKVARVALACAALMLNPTALPGFLQQMMPTGSHRMRALSHHPYSWQPLVFMKFGVGKKEFSALDAADWCLVALPDRCEYEDGAKSLNGFTRTAATLHTYFMLLEQQGFLCGIPIGAPEMRRFKPRFESVTQLQDIVTVPSMLVSL